MDSNPKQPGKLGKIWRPIIEITFIIFLFYSNLLMGEFTRTNGAGKTLAFAVQDIFTVTNFVIAVICALLGYLVIEYLRRRF